MIPRILHSAVWAGLASLGLAGQVGAQEAVPAQEQAHHGLAHPLGAPQPSYPVSIPTERNAFPAEIMDRMRQALVLQAENPGRRQAPPVRQND